jgi:lipid A 3-O-deacylase
MGFIGALTIYTPEDIGRRDLIPDERPYAGWTYGGLFFQRSRPISANDFYEKPGDSIGSFEALEIDLGIVGPSSLSQNAQEGNGPPLLRLRLPPRLAIPDQR